MEFYNFKKKLEEKEICKDNMIDILKKLEIYLNSELSVKIHNWKQRVTNRSWPKGFNTSCPIFKIWWEM